LGSQLVAGTGCEQVSGKARIGSLQVRTAGGWAGVRCDADLGDEFDET
jgi:hypothetical protein